MEYIKNIEITNFKSIEKLTINDCNRINLFIGYPNVGKSNILEALALMSKYTTPQNLPIFCRYKTYFNLFHYGNTSDPIKVVLNYKNGVIIKFDDHNNIIFERNNSHEEHYILASHEHSLEAIAENKNEIKEIKKYYFETQNNLKNTNQTSLSVPNGGNLFNIFQSNKNLRLVASELLNEFDLKLNVDIEKTELRIQKQTSEDTIFSLPYEMIAETFQRILFYEAAILSNKNSILLFEEPEAHCFPPHIKKIINDISEDKNDNQYFIVTHSPYVLSELVEQGKENLSVYIAYFDKETKIKKLSDSELDKTMNYNLDLFYNIESFLK